MAKYTNTRWDPGTFLLRWCNHNPTFHGNRRSIFWFPASVISTSKTQGDILMACMMAHSRLRNNVLDLGSCVCNKCVCLSSFWFYIWTNEWQVWQMLPLAEQTVQVCLDGSVLLWHAVLKMSWSDVCVVNDQMVVELTSRVSSTGSSPVEAVIETTLLHICNPVFIPKSVLSWVFWHVSKSFLGCCKTLLVDFSTLLGCSRGYSGLLIRFMIRRPMWIQFLSTINFNFFVQ